MTPEIWDFITFLLVETDEYVEVADGTFFKAKQTGEFQIKMCDNIYTPFIATLNDLRVPMNIFHCYVNEFRTYLTFS